jgi:transcriptional regulator with GAF, ATPase, and Fis domain
MTMGARDGPDAWALLQQAISLCRHLLTAQDDRGLVCLPPEGCSFKDIERAALVAALDRCGWHQNKAARLLKTTPRVICYKVQQHGLRSQRSHD